MVRIAPVKLPYNSRALWFDAREFDLSEGDPVVVLTARGLEFGRMAANVFEAEDAEVKKLKSPLKPVKRPATDDDVAQAEELARKGAEALPVFRELAAQATDEMHPVAVEYLFGGDKAVFYFESENRVDFRELVHKLAAEFHVRVDMRQVGVRDEARMIGGLGHCGQELCCKRFGGDFNPVSIRMAKEQDLSLNPQKISGICGRLMCCLRYEYDAYKDFKSRAPKANSTVQTPEGPAKVTGLDVPREIVTVRVEGGKDVKVPFAEMDLPEGDATRRTVIGEEAWERATDTDGLSHAAEARFSTSQFTRDDKLGEAKAVRRGGSSKKAAAGAPSAGEAEEDAAKRKRRKRRRSTKVESAASHAAEQKAAAPESSGKESRKGQQADVPKKKSGMQPRRRNRPAAKASGKAQGQSQTAEAAGDRPKQRTSPRPGQKSSGLRQHAQQGQAGTGEKQAQGQAAGRARNRGGEAGAASSSHRTARRRSHKASGSGGEGGSRGQGAGSAGAKGGADR